MKDRYRQIKLLKYKEKNASTGRRRRMEIDEEKHYGMEKTERREEEKIEKKDTEKDRYR